MNKIFSMVFWLILILIVVVYWRGATETVKTIGSGVNNIIRTLQGRRDDGTFANYPK